jgi:hypothetical protein
VTDEAGRSGRPGEDDEVKRMAGSWEGPSGEPGSGGMSAEVRPLSNDQWGFESSCFVCEPRNVGGLRIPFNHVTDDDDERVTASFALDELITSGVAEVQGHRIAPAVRRAVERSSSRLLRGCESPIDPIEVPYRRSEW